MGESGFVVNYDDKEIIFNVDEEKAEGEMGFSEEETGIDDFWDIKDIQ